MKDSSLQPRPPQLQTYRRRDRGVYRSPPRGCALPIISFGQGCEGEPLLMWETLKDAIYQIRKVHR